MKLLNVLFQGKYKKAFIIILLLLFAYLIMSLTVFDSDPVVRFADYLKDLWLTVSEKFANILLRSVNSPSSIDNHTVLINGILSPGFIPEIRFVKWMILFFVLIWLTPALVKSRIFFSFLLIAVHFLLVSVCLAFGAHFSSADYYRYSIISIPFTIALLLLISIFFLWYRKNKRGILERLSKLNVNTECLENERVVIITVYFFIIMTSFLFEYFDYNLWVRFLFTSAQKILALLGWEAVVEPFHLAGINGSIYMEKGCLGFQTMLLFAVLVFLTGRNNNFRWIYIFSGLLFLNFVNIMRFVLLFIHIQKHGGYALAMEVHTMYSLITYTIVFILWVIWFEKFADKKPYSEEREKA